jgi:hypothetical protein
MHHVVGDRLTEALEAAALFRGSIYLLEKPRDDGRVVASMRTEGLTV